MDQRISVEAEQANPEERRHPGPNWSKKTGSTSAHGRQSEKSLCLSSSPTTSSDTLIVVGNASGVDQFGPSLYVVAISFCCNINTPDSYQI